MTYSLIDLRYLASRVVHYQPIVLVSHVRSFSVSREYTLSVHSLPEQMLLTCERLKHLPEGSMLDQYLKSAQTIDKHVATANKNHHAEAHGNSAKEKNGLNGDAAIQRLNRFMGNKTDKTTLKQGRKDAKNAWVVSPEAS